MTRDWAISVGGENGTSAAVHVVEQPWWLHLVEQFAHWVSWGWLYRVKLPRWPVVEWSPSDPDEFSRCSPRDWYGDVGQVIHGYVTCPLIGWVHRHPRRLDIEVPVTYAQLRGLFYARHGRFFDDWEGRIAVRATPEPTP